MFSSVRRPSSCVFQIEGVARSFGLQWRSLSNAERDEGLSAGRNKTFSPPIGLRPFSEDGVWISMSSFDSTRGGAAETALSALNETITAQADALRERRLIVFDLRGNEGGSSIWMAEAARTLWGEDWVAANAADEMIQIF
jgi:hypothetical protein